LFLLERVVDGQRVRPTHPLAVDSRRLPKIARPLAANYWQKFEFVGHHVDDTVDSL
jgi:hypothetical protein